MFSKSKTFINNIDSEECMDEVLRGRIENYIRKCRAQSVTDDQIAANLQKTGVHDDIIKHLLKRVELEDYFIYDEKKLLEEKKKIEKAQEEFRKGSSLRVDEIMSFPVHTIDLNQPIKVAIRIMAEKDIGALIVTENGKPVAMVSERDLLVKVLDKELDYKRSRVQEIMSAPLIYGESGESLIEIETKMKLNKIRRIPILKNGEIAGIITSSDIIRVMAFV